MKTLPLTAIFISILSTSLPAQQLTSGDVLGNITLVDRNLGDISQQIKEPRKLAPFALSSLPNVDKLTTEPLTALPDSLSIETVTGKHLWFDVEAEQGWRAVKGQWILLADDLNKARLIGQGAVIINESRYSGLGMTLLRFNVPQAIDSKKALINILSAKASLSLARNHIYQTQSQARQLTDKKVVGEKLKTKSPFNACQLKVKVGLVDSAIDTNHDAFKQASITAKSFLPAELAASVQHGTVIASLFVGKAEQLVPLLPQGQIYSAEVFYQQSDYVQGATLSAMIAGINWLIEQDVKVINMSLAGPDNKILQAVLTSAMAKGALIIAAAGNEGPAAPPMFPAAYKDVIAVSAIDQFQQPYRWSNRGDYVDYSALGVNVLTAQSGQRVGRESGTSIAAPYVTAALACLIAKIGVNRNQLLEKLNESTIDLGPRGKDPIYGVGAIVSR
jgi:hypothetical protein